MFISLTSIILILFFSLLPLLFWGYGNLYLSDHMWNRARFFAGIIGWMISIVCIYFFKWWLILSGTRQLFAVIGVFIVLWILSTGVTYFWSPYIRWFLRRTLFFHIAIFSILLYLWGLSQEYIPMKTESLMFFSGISGFFIAAFLEEWVKHISSIWLTSREFRFSRTDFLLFTFFITLGFIVGENILYFKEAYNNWIFAILIMGIYRLLFALPLHIFAASICVMFWWKALSYRFLSWQYIGFFITGFILASGVHSLYNTLAEKNNFILLLFLTAIAYFSFTRWLIWEDISREKNN